MLEAFLNVLEGVFANTLAVSGMTCGNCQVVNHAIEKILPQTLPSIKGHWKYPFPLYWREDEWDVAELGPFSF